MESTAAMRARIRELATGRDDFDRAVLAVLDDLEQLLRPCGECHLPPNEVCDICNRIGPNVRHRRHALERSSMDVEYELPARGVHHNGNMSHTCDLRPDMNCPDHATVLERGG
jgi:hypothetical protein